MSIESKTREKRSKIAIACLAAILVLLPVAYVLSYAPAVKWSPESELVVYAPVEWLYDNTEIEENQAWQQWVRIWDAQSEIGERDMFRFSVRMVEGCGNK